MLFHWPKAREIKLVSFPVLLVRQLAWHLTRIHSLGNVIQSNTLQRWHIARALRDITCAGRLNRSDAHAAHIDMLKRRLLPRWVYHLLQQ